MAVEPGGPPAGDPQVGGDRAAGHGNVLRVQGRRRIGCWLSLLAVFVLFTLGVVSCAAGGGTSVEILNVRDEVHQCLRTRGWTGEMKGGSMFWDVNTEDEEAFGRDYQQCEQKATRAALEGG